MIVKFIKISIVLLIIISFKNLQAQQNVNYGNEWINFEQEYYKIPVSQNGIYKITRQNLAEIGFPLNIDPRRIQLYHRGQEQAIQVIGEDDNQLDEGDYILFYGKKNDGVLDSSLYYPTYNYQPHKYYNLYSDRSAYFLTYNLNNENGLRMEMVQLNDNIPADNYHLKEELVVFSEEYTAGRSFIQDDRNPIYLSTSDQGEGWMSTRIRLGRPRNFTINTQNVLQAEENPKLSLQIVGRYSGNHSIEFLVGPNANNLSTRGNIRFNNYEKAIFETPLQTADINQGQVVVRVVANGINGQVDDISITYIQLTYPQSLNLNNQDRRLFNLKANPDNLSKLNFTNTPANTVVYDITNPGRIRVIEGVDNGTTKSIVIDGTAQERKLFLSATPFENPSISKITFRLINPGLYNYLIVTHPDLMQAGGNYDNVVQAYADYRASVDGGGYAPIIADINQLYDQFNYGERSPIALKNFARFMYDGGNPEHLLIIGRSVTLRAYVPRYTIAFDIRHNPQHELMDQVPTFGYPASDVPFTAGFNEYEFAPAFPVGRIPAYLPEQVAHYLDKVKEHEAVSGNVLWKKNLLHMSGGNTEAEQTNFRAFVENYKQIAEGDFLGGKVKIISKKTDNNVEYINVSEEVNRGLCLLTFFGHSNPGIADIETGRASEDIQNYRNKGKYTMILANGCNLGDVFSGNTGASQPLAEDWLFTPDRGAILWLANTFIGFDILLNAYSLRFYNNAFANADLIGGPIGKIQQRTIQNYGNNISQSIHVSNFQQMSLFGDPAVSIGAGTKPDYYIQDGWLQLSSFNNTKISTLSDSLNLKIIVANIGITTDQDLEIHVRRNLSSGRTLEYTKNFSAVDYADTLNFAIPRPEGINAFGNNTFLVTLDPNNLIDEIKEDNNTATLSVFLPTVGVIPLLPQEYHIVNEQPLRLIAQPGDLQEDDRNYIIEIDTTASFNSPVKITGTLPGSRLPVFETQLLTDQIPSDSLVYYWRINFADAVDNPNVLWGESSFTYIKNSPEGWIQKDFPQFSKSDDLDIKKDFNTRKWNFREVLNRVEVITFGGNNPDYGQSDVVVRMNGSPIVFDNRCSIDQGGGFITVAFDRQTKEPYTVFDRGLCGRVPAVANSSSNNALLGERLYAIIDNMKSGDYLLILNTGNVSAEVWENNFDALLSLGASPRTISTLQQGHPYILLGQKDGEALAEHISTSIPNPTEDRLYLDINLNGLYVEGSVQSSLIGPAISWGTLYHGVESLEHPVTDLYRLDVMGLDIQGNEQLIIENVQGNEWPIDQIDASEFPYLKLRLWTRDDQNFSPSQLKNWTVLFDGVPEGVLSTENVSLDSEKTVGERIQIPFSFENLSTRPFEDDSLEVHISYSNTTSGQIYEDKIKIKSPAGGEKTDFVLSSSHSEGGEYHVSIYVNPKIAREQNYDNNLLQINYTISNDDKNPVLDVTFDGIRIMDGDIVSPDPLIAIRVRDDNPFLVRDNPEGIVVALKPPCENCVFEEISFEDARLNWAVEKNITNVEFRPQNLEDGMYTLQVQATDASGNLAGKEPYRVNFEVINASTVTHFFPYPNPFSDQTKFVFTLTGREIPDEIKIQIMTLSGKVVREILQDEIGPIRIGNNITDFAWNGTDEYGNKLANGVYLYRVIMRLNGKTLEQRATNADKGFKKGYGKLYILR